MIHSDISKYISTDVISKLTKVLDSYVISNRVRLYKVCSNNNFIGDSDIGDESNYYINSKPENLISIISQSLLKILCSFLVDNPTSYPRYLSIYYISINYLSIN
jgi:hypothetical protein